MPRAAAATSGGRPRDKFGACALLTLPHRSLTYYRLASVLDHGCLGLDRLPLTIKVVLENVLRHGGAEGDVGALAAWRPDQRTVREFPFFPARVLLQDFTGVPAVADLAAMRAAVARAGGDARRVAPRVPADLVIDHSLHVDAFGESGALAHNVAREYKRNRERYALLRWAQRAFRGLRVVPPGAGIVHQVNLEHLARVVCVRRAASGVLAFPDTVVGADSHTTMVNGLGVLGWGVGGIEAEAVLVGQPLHMRTPEIVGVRIVGAMPEGVTATDIVLTITQRLRDAGVVGAFVEFFGEGLSHLTVPDRATIANMAPEYGATAGLFPIDDETLAYLRLTGRSPGHVALVERYAKAQGLFRAPGAPEPACDRVVECDLPAVEPSVAGPRRPQDRVPLAEVRRSFREAFAPEVGDEAPRDGAGVRERGAPAGLGHGSVVIAALTSCTNTSNPAAMLGAGILARKAVARGLRVPPTVKTSLAPGSGVVTDYLRNAGLLAALESLRFYLVGYGCTTCIGNSGPLPEPVAEAIQERGLVAAAVLSGNRNFEGRIHPQVRASYLMSPALVVAFALAGTVDIDLTRDPLGQDLRGELVYLRDLWPRSSELADVIARAHSSALFAARYRHIYRGDEAWRALPVPEGSLYDWRPGSTYVQEPPFLRDAEADPPAVREITGARVLALLGDTVTTDHISPAGAIPPDSPAGRYLIERGVPPCEFNSYGARRGNHEVMVRGTFASIRLRNHLAGGRGGWTEHVPTGTLMTIYDAAARYRAAGIPLLVVAGREYGAGSSRDWAAKGTRLLGVRAVLAESFERIHRSNLVGMGVLPLEFEAGENATVLGLTGREEYDVTGIAGAMAPGRAVTVRARRQDGGYVEFRALVRLDTPMETEYYRHGGILPFVVRQILRRSARR
jgi:aconitate hydratase